MNAQELSKESLIKLRKMANELGIQNYAKYSKEELALQIEQAQAGITSYTDPEMIASDKDLKEEAQMVEEHAATVTEDAVDPEPEHEAPADPEFEGKTEKKAKAKKEKAPKKKKEPKEPKEKKEPRVRVKMSFVPKGEKPATLHTTSSKIYDELLKDDRRSYNQIAKDLGTHYNMVRRICETYFEAIPVDQVEE